MTWTAPEAEHPTVFLTAVVYRWKDSSRLTMSSVGLRGTVRKTLPLPDRDQAARTEWRNFPTSSLRRLLSRDSDCAAESTCEDAEPVSPAPRCTSTRVAETCP